MPAPAEHPARTRKTAEAASTAEAARLEPAGNDAARPEPTDTSARTRPASDAASAERLAQPARFVTPSFYNLFWIFILCSVGGLVVETLVSYPVDGVWKDRAGLVWGPLSPIYGVGGVLVTVALNRLRNARTIVLFAAAAIVGGLFELVAGWFWESAFGIVAWSYADQPFNIGGYTCLGIALVWGLAGLIWVKLALPVVMKLIELIPEHLRTVATAALATFVAVDVVVTLLAFNCWFERLAGAAPETPVQEFFAERFDDGFMEGRFQTMSIYPSLADRGNER